MLVYLAKRGIARLTLLVGAALAIFLLTRPLVVETTQGAMPAMVETLLGHARSWLGIDVPVVGAFASWLAAILGGDLGRSAAANVPVADLLRPRLSVTLQLLVAAGVIALALASPLGLIAARHPGGRIDRLERGLRFLAEAMPMAVFSLLLMLVFAIVLRWLPASGHVDPASDPLRALGHLLLPAIALAAGLLPLLLRAVRDCVEAARSDRHLVVARAYGASASGLMWGRALRLGLVPALVPLAALCGQALSGAVLVESIFSLPGLGRLMVESIVARDYVLMRAVALACAVAVVATGLASDLLRGLLDRRVRARSPA